MSSNEGNGSLIEKLEGLRCKNRGCYGEAHKAGECVLDKAIAIVHEHQAEQPQDRKWTLNRMTKAECDVAKADIEAMGSPCARPQGDKVEEKQPSGYSVRKCPGCGGNDADMPCLYPGDHEKQHGCWRNIRLGRSEISLVEECKRNAELNDKTVLEMLELHIVDYPTPENIAMQRKYISALKATEPVSVKQVRERMILSPHNDSIIKEILDAAGVKYAD